MAPSSRPVSAGVPHFFTDVRIDADGEPVAGAGPGRAAGARPPRLRRLLEPAGGDRAGPRPTGWYRSGDVVRIEDDGWAYVVDRVKDMIISGGENIYPAEVEAAIAELADVTAAAVVAVPDRHWGEVGCAYVVLRSGADLDEIALRAHLDQRLARYKIPRYIELCDDLPRNATGKVLRSVLRDQARRDHALGLTPSPSTPTHPKHDRPTEAP